MPNRFYGNSGDPPSLCRLIPLKPAIAVVRVVNWNCSASVQVASCTLQADITRWRSSYSSHSHPHPHPQPVPKERTKVCQSASKWHASTPPMSPWSGWWVAGEVLKSMQHSTRVARCWRANVTII